MVSRSDGGSVVPATSATSSVTASLARPRTIRWRASADQHLLHRHLTRAPPGPREARPLIAATSQRHGHGPGPPANQLDYGESLRRERRINDAKPAPAAALETPRNLGAIPWTRRAEAELRACGVTAQAAGTAPGALADLTPQQRQIVILASRGLTNGEIADRLFLSPRTVASHLYNFYPSSASPAATSSATSSTRPPTHQPFRRPADSPQTRANPRSAVTGRPPTS